MSKKKRRREQKSKRERYYAPKGKDMFRNDQLSKGLNKIQGLPEDFEGNIAGFEKEIPIIARVFGSRKAQGVPKDEKGYTP